MSTKLIDPSSGALHRIGRYDLVAEIAAGGMATVFLARLSGVGGFHRNVAIKCLHPHLARNLEFVEMFLDEARLAALIHHPNVVPILEVEESEQGYYLVMDYVEGDTFASLLSRSASLGKQVPREIALRVLIDTLTGLHAAHELRDMKGLVVGLVHRDVSPQNILVGTDGVARITDFGVARAASRLSATRAGQLKGKLAYMAPEQAGGEEEVDRRADVFSAGVVLWEALAFRRLFKASNEAATLTRVLTEPIVSPHDINPEIPESIANVCMKALERDLNRRYVSCAEFADALERAAVGVRQLATTREVAAFVLEVVGEDVESHRRAIRQWLDRKERSQGSLPSAARERFAPPSALNATGSDPFSNPPLSRDGSPTERPSLIGRLPPPSGGLGSSRPPGDAFTDTSAGWAATQPSGPGVSPARGLEPTVASLGVPPPSPASTGAGPYSEPHRSMAAALLAQPMEPSVGGGPPPPPRRSSRPNSAPSSFGGPVPGPYDAPAVVPASAPPLPSEVAPPRRKGLWIGLLTATALLLGFGVTWLVTDNQQQPNAEKPLPLRTQTALGSGEAPRASVPLAPSVPAEPVQSPSVQPPSAQAASGAAGAAPVVVAPPAAPPRAAVPTPDGASRVDPPRAPARAPAAPRRPPAQGPSKAPRPPAADLENPYQ